MEQKICQSCGMPLNTNEDFGTNQNGGINEEYCIYCFKEGDFTSDVSMEEMIQHCVQYLDEFNKDSETKFSKEQAIETMRQYFPSLKRWQRN